MKLENFNNDGVDANYSIAMRYKVKSTLENAIDDSDREDYFKMCFEDLIGNTENVEVKEMDINLRLVKVDDKWIILNQNSLNKEELNETKEDADLL
ncbi:hypothetical protein [Pseudostreptobacillus hongkongensis]|uniref:hypothetical protein n=1 Tax=Pseudostreptobacillus hongkongensis TaxID=1162717 RepID=UPI0028D0FFF9|nr:hypothetical protein [Pseudostreptobacillus hongkongensis]